MGKEKSFISSPRKTKKIGESKGKEAKDCQENSQIRKMLSIMEDHRQKMYQKAN